MKNVHKWVKTAGSLLLAMILCLQGLVPAVDFTQNAFVIQPGVSHAAAEGLSGTNDLDGSKIEGIKVVWVTQDSRTNNDGQAVSQDELNDLDHLYLATTSTSPLSMVYKIEAEFSGQYDYAPGDITITIPAQVWHARQYQSTGAEGETEGVIHPDRMIGLLELSVPAAPSKKADFNWQLIDGNYVLTNTRTIGATSSVSIEVAITGLNPMDMVDMSQCDPITAHCEVVTNQGNIIELTSLPINAQIDTQAKVTSAYKDGKVYQNAPEELTADLLANLPADTAPEDYIYVRWHTYHAHNSNQPFKLEIEDTLPDAYEYVEGADGEKTRTFITEGIFLGSTNYEGELLSDGTVDFTATIEDRSTDDNTSMQYSQTAILWSAYRKDAFPVPKANEPERVYYLENEVEWVVTEKDAAVAADQWNKPADPQKETRRKDSAVVTYSPMQWRRPVGSFAVFKWTENKPNDDWDYGYALNLLESGKPADMNFHLKTVGHGYPWTTIHTKDFTYGDLSSPTKIPYLDENALQESYGKLGWTQITHDFQTFFNFEETPLTVEDFQFKSLRVTVPERSDYVQDFGWGWAYTPNNSLPVPDLKIEYQLNNEDTWYPAATAMWGEDGLGEFHFVDVSDQCTTSDKTVFFPDNVTDVRHIFTSNVFGGVMVEDSPIACITWDVYTTISLKPSDRVRAIVANLYQMNENPSTKFKNDVTMDVYGWVSKDDPGELVFADDFDSSRATLSGASYGVTLGKSASYKNDPDNQQLRITYTATLTEQSNLREREVYDEAVQEGIIPAETSGTWYDLLPPKVVPLLGTIELREGDTLRNAYTIENYKNTGRTLLVVEADLSPVPKENGNGFADKPTLTFEAVYSWVDMDEYGTQLVNYIAFESNVDNLRNGTLGTLKHQQGHPDTPAGDYNITTPTMPTDILNAMTGLNPDSQPGENRFVYAKCDHSVVGITYAVSGLDKSVSNDLVGLWTQGLDGQEQVTVYEGHGYTYRLRISSAENTSTKGIIIYDTIENYIIPDPNADEDTDATKAADYEHTEERKEWNGDWQGKGQWRGTLKKVDLSEFVNAGVAPVLLYSQLPGLQFADSKSGSTDDNFEEDTELFSSGTYDITNRDIWQVAELDENGVWTVPEGVNVSAVAIDATTDINGREYVLAPEQSLSGYLRMVAPDDNSDPDVWNAKGAYARNEDGTVNWEAAQNPENNMYAFNNARVRLVQGRVTPEGTNWLSDYRMIRNDYTRVGIIPGVLHLQKVWKDQNNHDGLRPESVTVTMLRKVAGTAGEAQPVLDSKGKPITVTMSEENGWKTDFYQMDIADINGSRYLYSFEEEPVDGYTYKVKFVDMTHYQVINIHPNEQIPIEGEKTWDDEDDSHAQRPESITLNLFRNDELIATKTVTPASDGSWDYSFGKMDKYADGGEPFVYRVEEEYVPKYIDEVDGYTRVDNMYYPLGNLEVTKTLENATPAAAEKTFSFKLVLLSEQTDPDAPAVPLMDKYHYIIYQQEGTVWDKVSEGEISNGSTFQLKDGQKLRVENLPSESTYQIIETEAAGFTVTSTDAEGTIRAGETARAEFTNTYAAKGGTQLGVAKNLSGRKIRKNQFRFELVDNNEGSATYGQVIRTARVNAPDADATTGGSGQEILSGADAIFGQLNYTEADAGKTFQYIVREVDIGADGFEYDTTQYDVAVTVEDENGEGTLTVTHNFMDESMTFDNSYSASGEVVLKAWKILEGRTLKEGEFTFELYPYDPDTNTVTGECIATATNDAEGNISFAALSFTQDDVSLNDEEPATYHYMMQEQIGSDRTVEYSSQVYFVDLKVYDNGDGTLSFVQDQQTGMRTFLECEDCGGSGISGMPDVIGKNVNFVQYLSDEEDTDYEVGGSLYNSVTLCPACYGLAYVDNQLCSACKGSGLEVGGGHETLTNGSSVFYYEYTEYVQVPGTERGYVLGRNASTGWDYLYQTIPETIEKYASCDTCSSTGKMEGPLSVIGENAMPVFNNQLRPGNLSITKQVEGEGSSNPDQQFTFHVKFTGEVPDEVDYSIDPNLTPTPVPTPTPDPGKGLTGGYISPRPANTPKPTTEPVVKAFTPPNTPVPFTAPNTPAPRTPLEPLSPSTPYKATNLSGEALAILNLSSGQLTFFRTTRTRQSGYYVYYTYNGPASNYYNVNVYFQNNSSARDRSNVVTVNGTKYIMFRNFENRTHESKDSWPWYTFHYFDEIKSVRMEGDLRPASTAYMFYSNYKATSFDLSRLDTSRVTDMTAMFYYCKVLPSIDLSTLDFSNVTCMKEMFHSCEQLRSIDLSTVDTSKVTNMNSMFRCCYALTDLDLSSFNTSNVTDMGYIFAGCRVLTELDVSTLDTSKAENMSGMFSQCSGLTELDVSTFDTSSATNMGGMFSGCRKLTSIDVSSFDTSKVTHMGYMFSDCSGLTELDLSTFDTRNVTNTGWMFWNCSGLTKLDVSSFDTSNVTNMEAMFRGCTGLTELDVSTFDVSNTEILSQLFYDCTGLTSIDVSTFDTRNATSMSCMFYNCSGLTELDVSTFDTSKVKSMYAMFRGCSGLTELDVSAFNTSNVTDFSSMFSGCSGLTELDVSTFDTSKAYNTSGMFSSCSGLTSLDVSTFDISKARYMNGMFSGCSSLTSLDLSNFNTIGAESMYNMFSGCSSLTSLDLSTFNTSNVTSMYGMFKNCSGLETLDLRNFDVSKAKYMYEMFSGCSSLTSINVSSFNNSANNGLHHMFKNCSSLTSLDLSSFTIVAPMYNMFQGCTNLQYLDMRNFSFYSNSTQEAFEDCDMLSTVVIGNSFKARRPWQGYIPFAPSKNGYDGTWYNVDNPDETIVSYKLFSEGKHAGTWSWKKAYVKLNFDPGEGAGSMASVDMPYRMEYSFVPTFYRLGYKLIGFTDGTKTYSLKDGLITIPANNGYASGQEVTLTALWATRGSYATLENGEYTFTLKAGATITFENLPASLGYEVWEDTPAGWVLIKKVNENGEIQPLETSEVVFTNEYNPGKTSASLRAAKLMDGAGAEAGAFTFTLSENGTVLQTKKNESGGGISFDIIEYGQEDVGVHTYTIAETAGSDPTVSYDENSYTVTVTVTDDGEGNLSAAVEYEDGEPPVFQNTTKPGSLTIRKATQGATEAAAGQTFTVQVLFTNNMGQPWNGTVTANDNEYTLTDGLLTAAMGNGDTLNISGIPAGIHYQVSEPELLPGWIMDSEKTGVIQSTMTSSVDLLNAYTVKGVAGPEITKVLAGRTLTEDEFTFQLVNPDNEVVGTASNAADGTVIFLDLSFDAEGTYYFAAVEIPGNDETVSYSQEVVFISVTMTDLEGKGLLTPTITYTLRNGDGSFTEGADTITNRIKPGKLSVSKQVISENPAHATQNFTFTLLLTDELGQPISGQYFIEKDGNTEYFSVTGGNGSFTLRGGETALISGLPHGANYAVTEAAADGFTQKHTGATGAIVVNQTASASFTNTYAAKGKYTPTASKSLTGKEMEADEFVFALLDAEGYELLTARNNAEGNVTFADLSFTHADVGTKVYQMVEKDSGVGGMVYDSTVQTITLTIADNGDGTLSVTDDLNGQPVQFTNSYNDKTSHTVNKVWLDEEDALGLRPGNISVELYQNRVKYREAVLTAEGGWSYTFTDLPAFDEQGIRYTYEVREVPVPGYTTGVNTQGNVTTLTNMPLGVLEVTKTVTEGNLQKAFPFTVTLTLDGEPLTGSYVAMGPEGETEAQLSGEGAYTFRLKHDETMRITGLPIGTAYAVTEVTGEGYVGEVTEGSAEGYIQRNVVNKAGFTNSAKTTTFKVTKVWEGGSGAITLTLYANGVKMDPQPKYTREGDVYTYENLRMYDDDGLTIEYSAKEKYFDGFVTIYENVAPYENVTNMVHNGGTIINRQIREADFQVYKRWRGLDENATPPAITLTLYCNGEKMNYDTPTPSNGWYKYYGLPDHYNGEPAVYTVVEEPLPGYETSYQDGFGNEAEYADNGGTIINTRIPGTGDSQPIGLWTALAGLSLLALVIVVLGKRKKG